MSIILSVEELTFLSYYKAPEKDQTIQEIKRVIPQINDPEMHSLAADVLSKLDMMSTEEHNSIDFSNAIDIESVDEVNS